MVPVYSHHLVDDGRVWRAARLSENHLKCRSSDTGFKGPPSTLGTVAEAQSGICPAADSVESAPDVISFKIKRVVKVKNNARF
jgi:hypothetical protein